MLIEQVHRLKSFTLVKLYMATQPSVLRFASQLGLLQYTGTSVLTQRRGRCTVETNKTTERSRTEWDRAIRVKYPEQQEAKRQRWPGSATHSHPLSWMIFTLLLKGDSAWRIFVQTRSWTCIIQLKGVFLLSVPPRPRHDGTERRAIHLNCTKHGWSDLRSAEESRKSQTEALRGE